MAMER